jgi:hypothetical protein
MNLSPERPVGTTTADRGGIRIGAVRGNPLAARLSAAVLPAAQRIGGHFTNFKTCDADHLI